MQTKGRIRWLDEATINQIAAGEVVESPANVIKELVENAIDAQAKRITVEVVDGGFSLIKIIDDGHGFLEEDLKICLKKHTTSKIRSLDDLFKITSMGFRGEALASIASISELSIHTKSRDEHGNEPGYRLTNFPEHQIVVEPRRPGTTIEVKSLFYNVPARKAFQKTASQALTEIIRTMTKLALGFPSCQFELIAQGKTVFSHQPLKEDQDFHSELREAIENTLGRDFLKNSFLIHEETQFCTIRGFLGGFQATRSNRLGQHLFINQRAVIAPLIAQVIKNGYGTRIDYQVHPIFVLHLDFPPHLIDINVHPQKKEVRIQEGNVLYEEIKKAVIKTLIQAHQPKENRPFLQEEEKRIEKLNHVHNSGEGPFMKPWSFSALPGKEEQIKKETQPELNLAFIPILGRLYRYLIVETENLLFLDLNIQEPITLIHSAALEHALAYEKMKKSLNDPAYVLAMQTVLFPIHLEMSFEQMKQLENQEKALERWGVALHQVGPKSYQVTALMEGIDSDEVGHWIEMIVPHLQTNKKEFEPVLKKVMKKFQPSSKIQSERQLYYALKELSQAEEKVFSPAGLKIFSGLSESDLNRICLN